MASENGEVTLAVFGSPKVGKSALTVRLLTKRFIGEYDSSTVSTYCGEIKHDTGDILKFSILDYPGNLQEVTTSLLATADCCVVVYSVTDSGSFNEAISYVETISKLRDTADINHIIILLLGNKRDLVCARKVSYEEGKCVAARLGCVFFEVSAAEDYLNVQTVFQELLLQVKRTRLADKRQRKLSAKKKAVKLFSFGGRARSGTL